jgi:uncharacterized protein (TIGR02145 family)
MFTSPFNRLAFVMIIALLAILQTTCKEDDKDLNPPDQDIIIPESTRVITEVTWDEYFLDADSTDWTLTMDPGITLVEGISVGDVIVVPKGQGLLRRVTDIQSDNGIVVIKTEFASVCDAIEKGSLTFQQDLSGMMKNAVIKNLRPGVKIQPVVKDGDDSQISFTIEVPIHDNITITGELSLDPAISGEVEIEDYSLVYLRMEFEMEEKFELSTAIDIATLEYEKELEIAQVTFPTITVMVGAVPVLITPEFVLNLGVNVNVSSELSVGVIQELTVNAGVEYKDGEWSPISGLEKSFGHEGPALENTLEAKAYIKPEFSMLIYGIISPSLSSELYGLLEANLTDTPWWTLYAGLSADIGIEIKIWIFTLADYSVNLFDYKYPIASAEDPGNTKPTAVFAITPATGSVDTVFTFDASASFDAEDLSSSLEVRWDWQDDGSWDTEFSSDKVSTHQYTDGGQKKIRLEIRDSGGLTDDETRTLSVAWGAGGGGVPCPGLEEFEYEGQTYHTVLIGQQCWMKENLNVGTMIPGTQASTDNGILEKYCYGNDNANCEIYGGLYKWDEMMQYDTGQYNTGICPPGWHIPSDKEWTDLSDYLGASAGLKMKSTSGWVTGGNGTNESGFTALPGGLRAITGGFGGLGESTYYWTTREHLTTDAWRRRLDEGSVFLFRETIDKDMGFSVRCVQ